MHPELQSLFDDLFADIKTGEQGKQIISHLLGHLYTLTVNQGLTTVQNVLSTVTSIKEKTNTDISEESENELGN